MLLVEFKARFVVYFILKFNGMQPLQLLSFCFAVPVPTVQVEIDPFDAVPYAGNNVSIRCRVTLLGGVIGTDVRFSNMWTKNGTVFSDIPGRVKVHEEFRTFARNIFYYELQFSPLSSSVDNGTYMCNVTVIPVQQQFVIGTAGAGSMVLNVIGKYIDSVHTLSFRTVKPWDSLFM